MSLPNTWAWIRTNAAAITVVCALVGGVWYLAELVGTLRTTTRVDEVDEKVDALRAEMEMLAATVYALRTATNDEVDDLRAEVTATNDKVDDLTTVTTMLLTRAPTNDEVDALRAAVETLATTATNPTSTDEVDALRTEVETLREIIRDCGIEQINELRGYLRRVAQSELTLVPPPTGNCLERLAPAERGR